MRTDDQIAIVLLQGKELTSDGNNKKTEWTEIEQSEYPFYFSVDLKWEHGKRFRVIPHMKAKNGEKLTFALKQCKDATKKINTVSDKNRDYYEKIEKGEAIYYRPPYKKTNGQERSNWYVSIGSETIIVTFDDGTIENMTVVSETIHPEHEDYCKKLIEDLVAIDQKLCIDEKKKSSIDVYKNKTNIDTIDKFCELFDCIEASPAFDLKSDYRKVPKDKVKRYSPKNIIQIATNQPKVDSIVLEESIDIYEHRLIKYYANKLEKYIDIQKRNLKTNQSSMKEKLETLNKQFKTVEAEAEAEKLRDNIGDLEKEIKRLNNSAKKISKRNETEFFKKVSDTKVGLHMTNLFRYSPNYRKMYRFISNKSIQERLESVDLIDLGGQEISVDKIESIYEHWVLIKILSEFMLKYEFELSGYKYKDTETLVAGANGREGLRKCIKEIIKDKTDNLSGSEFVLVSNDLGLEVVVNYEKKIGIEVERLKAEKKLSTWQEEHWHDKVNLWPDFVISIGKIGGKSPKEYFVFDAKYRYGMSHYNGVEDLSEVAFQKYTLCMADSQIFNGNSLTGSFIIHNAHVCEQPIVKLEEIGSEKYVFEYNPKLYLGTSPGIFIPYWEKQGMKSMNVSVDKFKEWSGKIQSENKLGILKVSLEPDGDNFSYLIQMIMEKYFNKEGDRCWLCGDPSVNKIPDGTKVGNPTEVYTCNTCGAFWKQTVSPCSKKKIIKHRINYYPHLEGQLFYVLCPYCRGKNNKCRGQNKPVRKSTGNAILGNNRDSNQSNGNRSKITEQRLKDWRSPPMPVAQQQPVSPQQSIPQQQPVPQNIDETTEQPF